MPEGVEVRISAELIKPLVVGKFIIKANVGHDGRYAANPPEGYEEFQNSYRKLEDIGYIVSSLKVTDVKSKGKFMYWSFDNGWYMFSTFGMTGQWSPIEGKHLCFKFKLADPNAPNNQEYTNLCFNDPRHFGSIKFVNSEKELKNKLNELGWDPLNGSVDKWFNWIQGELIKSKKPIGQMLLDQSIFAGVGNYIRAEALYKAKISPWKIAKSLSKNDVKILCNSIVDVMNESYAHQGATLLTYKDAYGNEGKYSSCFKVYGKSEDPLGNLIKSENTPEGRTIHWCPNVQK